MARDIKTVDVVKGGIKTVDKASIGVERIKETTIKLKDDGKDAVKSEGQENISSYASSKVETVSEGVAIEAAHQTKETIKKSPERIKRSLFSVIIPPEPVMPSLYVPLSRVVVRRACGSHVL